MGLLWFAVTLRLAGQGLGWAVPAYLALRSSAWCWR